MEIWSEGAPVQDFATLKPQLTVMYLYNFIQGSCWARNCLLAADLWVKTCASMSGVNWVWNPAGHNCAMDSFRTGSEQFWSPGELNQALILGKKKETEWAAQF